MVGHASIVLNPSNLEHLALKGLTSQGGSVITSTLVYVSAL